MIKDIIFSGFHEEDFPEIQRLWEETGLGNPERKDDAKTIVRCNSMGGKFICMRNKQDNEIIGTSWMTFDGRRMFLHHFCIKPSWQGKGLANILGDESLKFMKEQGYQIKLEVHKENFKAKTLYEKQGFFAFPDYDIYMMREL